MSIKKKFIIITQPSKTVVLPFSKNGQGEGVQNTYKANPVNRCSHIYLPLSKVGRGGIK